MPRRHPRGAFFRHYLHAQMPDRSALVEAWLRHVLKGRQLRLETASSDASFRRYFRVSAGEDSYIVMDAPPGRENCREFVRIAAMLRAAGLGAPRVYECDLEAGLLLLEDLGTEHYLDALREENADRLYGDAFRALVVMQRGVSVDGIPDYDRRLLDDEMALFPDWFLTRHLGLTLSAPQAAALRSSFDVLIASAAEQPQVFVHRDFHSRNLMVRDSGNPGILDFQDAVRGPVTYDLVSLLRDVYIHWPPQRLAGWLDACRRLAVAQGVLADPGPCRWQRWFDLMGVQRHIKIAGIFARLYYRDGKAAYLGDIPLTVRYLCAQCARYRELEALDALLLELRIATRLQARNAKVLTGKALPE